MPALATITYKNQLTIPKEITDALNLEGSRRVLISVKNKILLVEPLLSEVDTLAGSLSYLSAGKSANLKRVRVITQKKVAGQIAKEGL